MIRYDKGWWGLKTFGKMYGSAFPKALMFSLSASALAGVLSYFFSKELDEAFIHPYPFQTFAFVAGFMVVFRCVIYCVLRSQDSLAVRRTSAATQQHYYSRSFPAI